MKTDSDVNPAYAAWKLSTDPAKDGTLEELLKRMQTFAKAICWQKLPDHASDLDALVNGIVWRAIQNEPSFKAGAKFSTWFYRIIVNECHRYLKTAKTKAESPLEEDVPVVGKTPEYKVDIDRVMAVMTEEDRRLVRMMAEGEDWVSIGKAFGITRQSAGMRWRRIMEKIRDAI